MIIKSERNEEVFNSEFSIQKSPLTHGLNVLQGFVSPKQPQMRNFTLNAKQGIKCQFASTART